MLLLVAGMVGIEGERHSLKKKELDGKKNKRQLRFDSQSHASLHWKPSTLATRPDCHTKICDLRCFWGVSTGVATGCLLQGPNIKSDPPIKNRLKCGRTKIFACNKELISYVRLCLGRTMRFVHFYERLLFFIEAFASKKTQNWSFFENYWRYFCLLYTSPSPRD